MFKSLFRFASAALFAGVLGCSTHSTIWLFNVVPNTVVPSLVCDSSTTTGYGGGTGTSADPYAICSPVQWLFLATDSASWNKYFKLYANLDFTGVTFADFNMIGNTTTAFTGQLDGNNFSLMNLNITSPSADISFFKKTDGNVTIKNLTLKNITLNSGARVAGLILNHANGGTLNLENIALDTLNLNMTVGNANENGGLIGRTDGPANFNTIRINSIIFANPPSSSNFNGGLLGYSVTPIVMSNITGNTISFLQGFAFSQIGGLAGYIRNTASFSNINLTGLNLKGDLVGGLTNGTYSTTVVSQVHLAGSIAGGTRAAGLIVFLNSAGVTNTTVAESSFDGNIAASDAAGLICISYHSNLAISKSYFKGNITDIWNGIGAGLVRNAQDAATTLSISDSYAVSNLTGIHATNYRIAGLVGGTTNTTVIARSYYSGTLNGTMPKACIGQTSGAISYLTADVYYNSTLCLATADVSGGAIPGSVGLATAALQTATPFTNWLPSVWTFSNSQNPKLSWEP